MTIVHDTKIKSTDFSKTRGAIYIRFAGFGGEWKWISTVIKIERKYKSLFMEKTREYVGHRLKIKSRNTRLEKKPTQANLNTSRQSTACLT